MFGLSKPSRTQTEQLLDELAESYGHVKLAAGHVAGGAAEKITPPYDKARNAASRGWIYTKDAFSPLYEQVREGAANARKENDVGKGNRWPTLVGLLAAGAAVGAAGAMVARRRRAAAQWDEYEPMPAIDDIGYGAESQMADTSKDRMSSATKKVTAGAASVAETVSEKSGKIAETLHEKAGTSGSSGTSSTAEQVAGNTGDMAEKAAGKAGDAASTTKDKASGKGTFSSFAEETADDVAAKANAKNTRP